MKYLLSLFLLLSISLNAEKPNIVFIMADDLGINHLSTYGQKRLQTPHIDKLAELGLKFTNAYAGSTVCGPSRSSLMTGLHSGHIPYKGNGEYTDLDPNNITIGEVMKKAGYNTAYFGKWGLSGQGSQITPNDLGYDEFLGVLSHGHGHRHYPSYLIHNGQRLPIANKTEGANTSRNKEDRKVHTHDAFTDAALKFIDKSAKDSKKPFFCFLSFTLPHTEIIATDEAANEFLALNWPEYTANTGAHIKQDKARAHFAGMLRMVDNSVGAVYNALGKRGILDNTLIIFTSDNGGQLKKTWGRAPSVWFDANSIYRGGKEDLYEGGIKVPMIAYWKGKTPVGKVTEHKTYFADFLPTFAHLSKSKKPSGIDGVTILPTLLGKESKQKQHPYLIWNHNNRRFAVRKGPWKAVKHGTKALELYNLDEDPSEKKNIAQQNPEIAEELEKIIKKENTPGSTKPRPSRVSPKYPNEK